MWHYTITLILAKGINRLRGRVTRRADRYSLGPHFFETLTHTLLVLCSFPFHLATTAIHNARRQMHVNEGGRQQHQRSCKIPAHMRRLSILVIISFVGFRKTGWRMHIPFGRFGQERLGDFALALTQKAMRSEQSRNAFFADVFTVTALFLKMPMRASNDLPIKNGIVAASITGSQIDISHVYRPQDIFDGLNK